MIVAVPNRVNPNAPTELAEQELTNSTRNLPGSGPHVITYSKASYKFHQQTGFARIPSVSIVNEGTTANPRYARPYLMYGAYQTVSPWRGFDTGIVYYEELKRWKLFFNGLGTGWWESPTQLNLSAGSEVYLHMAFTSNSFVNVIVRNANTWAILDQVSYWYNGSFTNNPINIELTRETSFAQHVRANANSKLLNARWREVYLYSSSQTVLATSTYLQAKNTSTRIPWSASLPLYIIGDNAYDKTKIKITSPVAYYSEIVSIDLNINPTW